jgi:hypothetical protein
MARTVCGQVTRMLDRHKTVDDGQISLLDSLTNASVQVMVATGPCSGRRVLRLGSRGD